MKTAQVSGMGILVFNANKPQYNKTYGLANIQKIIPIQASTVMYRESFAKIVFAQRIMPLVHEKVIDLDKLLAEYFIKGLPDYEINGCKRGFQDLKNDNRYKKKSADMFLTHTTGFLNGLGLKPTRN